MTSRMHERTGITSTRLGMMPVYRVQQFESFRYWRRNDGG
jgi:hypothetical protein